MFEAYNFTPCTFRQAHAHTHTDTRTHTHTHTHTQHNEATHMIEVTAVLLPIKGRRSGGESEREMT